MTMTNEALSVEDSSDDLPDSDIENFSGERFKSCKGRVRFENDPPRDKINLENNLVVYQKIYNV